MIAVNASRLPGLGGAVVIDRAWESGAPRRAPVGRRAGMAAKAGILAALAVGRPARCDEPKRPSAHAHRPCGHLHDRVSPAIALPEPVTKGVGRRDSSATAACPWRISSSR